MSWFDNLSLRYKLLINFLASGGILIAAIVFSVVELRSAGRDMAELAGNSLPSIQAIGEISQLRLRYRVRSLEYMLPDTPEAKAKLAKDMGKLDGMLREAFARYEKLISSDKEREVYKAAIAAADDYKASVEKAVALTVAGDEAGAQQLRKTEWVKNANKLRDRTDELTDINRQAADALSEQTQKDLASGLTGAITALIGGTLMALLVSYVVAQRMGHQLDQAVAATERIAEGNLTGDVPGGGADEIGKLLRAVAHMQLSLRSTIGESLRGAGQVLEASKALNHSVQMIDESASIQSSAASAIAANVEELTVSINHVSDSTGEAARLAGESDKQASHGRQAIDALVDRINQVADVVREASEQITNLKNESEK
ncbi:MAG TPA: methyl-accepting chemotaxis protein, partial [Azonexus sp.]|nr:methyl-accepting chemotaxis protein [Azonexus sp.]